ncbi:type II secretion system F family protein [Methylotenera versatilis]|uniref:type II secretion system F family protein n=1 Tax=Methylotenera versatilis TaxID=1055487 RepID=UPI00064920F1|nr:type II secretion system F family protein [Methylotenera versatilis]
MNSLTLIFIVLMLASAVFLLIDIMSMRKNNKLSDRFEEALQSQQQTSNQSESWLRKRLKPGFENGGEISQLLVKAGWDTPHARMLFWGFGRILPIVASITIYFLLVTLGNDNQNALLMGVFSFASLFVLANMILRRRAAFVEKAIVKELVPFLHMLRMLFNSGLSLEHALIILVEQTGNLFPHFSRQLQRVLLNLNAGQDQSDALMNMAKALNIQEVTDTVAILAQVTRYGGNVQASLGQYIALIETRQFSSLREYVSKLSAKMSIVMIVFMFPALLIFIAGPGFIGISDALKGQL